MFPLAFNTGISDFPPFPASLRAVHHQLFDPSFPSFISQKPGEIQIFGNILAILAMFYCVF